MTTQDYINEELKRDQEAAMRALARQQKVYFQQHPAQTYTQIYGNGQPTELILLRAKVRELTDKLAAERERCARIAETSGQWARVMGDTTKRGEEIAEKIMEGN